MSTQTPIDKDQNNLPISSILLAGAGIRGSECKQIIVANRGTMAISHNCNDMLITCCPGSCLAVAVYDPVIKVGGLMHCILPSGDVDPEQAKHKPALYVDTGVPLLLERLHTLGLHKQRAMVTIAGASVHPETGKQSPTAEQNCETARNIMHTHDMLIRAEHVGKLSTQTLRLDMTDGACYIWNGEDMEALD